MKFDLFKIKTPGPGVPDNEPEQPRWKLFLKIFADKLVQILGLNFLYVVFSIPSFILSYFISYYIIGHSFDLYFGFTLDKNLFEMLLPRVLLGILMVIVPAVAIGPIHAGFTYVLRNFTRREHAYVWWDFKDHAIANMKQGLLVTLFNVLIVFVLGTAINQYIVISSSLPAVLTYAAIGFLSLVFAVFLSMNFYIYPLMITYDMKITELYKVAYSFAFFRLIPNLLLLLAIIVILVLAYGILPWLGPLLTVIILPGGILYLINYVVDPVIKKFEEEQDLASIETDEIE